MGLPPLGSRFRSKRPFSGVPAGTTCTVVQHHGDSFTVEWDRPIDIESRGGKPPVLGPRPLSEIGDGLRDGFALDELSMLEPLGPAYDPANIELRVNGKKVDMANAKTPPEMPHVHPLLREGTISTDAPGVRNELEAIALATIRALTGPSGGKEWSLTLCWPPVADGPSIIVGTLAVDGTGPHAIRLTPRETTP